MQLAILAIIVAVSIPAGLSITSVVVALLNAATRASERNARNKRHAATLAATRARYARKVGAA